MPAALHPRRRELTLGGQAVLEGVVMRSKETLAIAVRMPNGKITVKRETFSVHSSLLWKIPFFRGMLALVDTLVIGMKALSFSAQASQGEEEKEISSWELMVALFISTLFAVFLFVFLPYLLTWLLGLQEQQHPLLFNAVDGLMKVAILLLYLVLISQMADIKRVFQYHGAEHKAVNCYEKGLPLTSAAAAMCTTKHPRCGTTFLLLTVLTGVVVFTFIPVILLSLFPSLLTVPLLARSSLFFSCRIVLIPVVAGVSYELLKLGGKHANNPIMRIILAPGMLAQSLTTQEPDKKQLEVALRALKAVL